MGEEKVSVETKNIISNFYRKADKYADRLDLHGELAYKEYVEFVKRFVAQNSTILDLGCGTGLPSLLLAKEAYRVIGMDISPVFVERAKIKERDNLKFTCGDILNIPFKDMTFDCVAIFLVIEHVPDIPAALDEMLRITKPGGKIIILSPNLLSPFNILYPLIDSLFGKKVNFMFGVNNPWKIGLLLVKNTLLLLKKEFCTKATFNYRKPVLENRVDFIADNDSVYLACPVDFKHYFQEIKTAKIINYQGFGKIGKIFPDFSTGIHIVIKKN